MSVESSVENKVFIWLPIFCVLGLFPLMIFRIVEHDWIIAALDFSLIIILGLISFNAITGKDQTFAFSAVVSAVAILPVAMVYLKGAGAIVWFYPAIAVIYYFVSPRRASLLSAIMLMFVLIIIFEQLESFQFFSTAISMVITVVCSFTFAYQKRFQANKLYELSHKDALTKTYNRRAYIDTMDSITNSSMDNQTWLLLFDLDHFKTINDKFGHSSGDDVLTQVCDIIFPLIADNKLFRVGGEEFAITMDNQNTKDAFAFAEIIRTAIESASIIPNHQVTISCGLSELQHGETPSAWYKRADDALYQAKTEGRNKTVLA
ncbi:GGDEF domain-containing protein [Thalassotalea euphylliae]|uniref:GGDEF domain-containing protein n=1 Tax=Thalassotalea euphylliae TaxID=1655234 RepID=UPI00364463D1